jgi:phosphoribosylformylglycinamidine synthase
VVNSAHDTAEGGLFVALIESAMQKNMGFEITTDSNIRKDAFLFGEAQSRVVVSVSADKVAAFEAAMGSHPYSKIGTVKAGGNIKIDNADWGYIKDWKEAYDTAIEKLLNA